MAAALDELSRLPGLSLVSFGRYADIVKDVGTVKHVSKSYGISSYQNILYGIGHVRTATMSGVNPVTAHPFCSSTMPDVAVVHNGAVTNAARLKRKLQVMGFPFFAQTDSEVIAAYIGERLNMGYDLEKACYDFVENGDGPYSFLLATPQGIAFVKDTFGLRPAIVGYNPKQEFYAIATDIAALNKVGASEQRDLPGNGIVRIFNTGK